MPENYSIEVDNLDKRGWEDVLLSFEDANLYQTWSWGAVRWGEKNLSHVVLKKDGAVVAAAQAWIIRLPFINKGIAYVKRGPLWQARNGHPDPESYRLIVRALKEEYAQKRGLLLRVMPGVTNGTQEEVYRIMKDEGFGGSSSHASYRTFMVDLSMELEELRSGLKKNWRRNLSRALRSGLTLEDGSSDEMFDVAEGVYNEMRARKKFADYIYIDELKRIQRSLGQNMKMRVVLCRYQGKPVSAYISSLVGGTGIDLISGTIGEGLNLNSAYLTNWRMLEWMKASGCRWYDLGGIEPVKFPGPYSYKSGLSGSMGIDTSFSQFDFCLGSSSRLAVKAADNLNYAYRTVKNLVFKV